MNLRRGDIFWFEVELGENSYIQGGKRPWLVVSNDIGNSLVEFAIVIPLTTKLKKMQMPTHVPFVWGNSLRNSVALCEQIRTVDIPEDAVAVWHLDKRTMDRIDVGLHAALFMKGAR